MASSSSLRLLRHLRCLSTTVETPAISISKAKAKPKLRTKHDPDKTVEICSSVSDGHSSPTKSALQDIPIRRLVRSRRFKDIESIIDSRKNDPDKVKDEAFLSNIIRSYGRAGMFDKALRTFNQMEDLGASRSLVSFNSLLYACNYCKQFDKVPQLFDEIPKKHNLSPDQVTYGILVKSYCDQGSIDKAIEVVDEMEKMGTEVTAVTFTTVLDALYDKEETEEAEKWWTRMKNGKGAAINTVAYNVLIRHTHGGDPEKVKALFEEMTQTGLKPDTVSYNYLMSCYFERGMVDKGKKVFEDLDQNKCRPNAVTFRTVVHHLCQKGDFDQAYEVLKRSIVAYKIPSFDIVEPLVDGLVKKKKLKEAKEVIWSLKKKVSPNAVKMWERVEERLGFASNSNDVSSSDNDDK